MWPVLACLLVIACSAAPVGREPPRAPDQTAELDGIVRATLAEESSVGLAVIVMRDGKVVWSSTYGPADRETQLAMTLDTPMRIGSVTKPFTAVAVMQLVAAGKIGLDDPIDRYLDLPAKGHRITVRQLLSQRSGLPNYVALIQQLDGNFDRTAAEIFALFRDVAPEFEPGTQDRYSNTNYYVLGLLVEKVSGESFAAYLRTHVTAPAGPATVLCGPTRARGYDLGSNGALEPQPDVTIAAGFASGGLCSTATELARWFSALYRGDLVPAATLATMTTVPPLPDGSHADDGFGLAVYDIAGHVKWNKSGAIAGFSASSTYLPDQKLLVIIAANTCCDATTLADVRLTRALLPGMRPDVPLAPTEAARFTGRWIRVTEIPGRPAAPMRATVRGSHVRFTFDDGFTWHYRYVGGGVLENELAPGTTLRATPDGLELIDAAGKHFAIRRLG